MDDFQLQNEINETTRQNVDQHLEKRKLEIEVAHQNELIQKKYDKLLVAGGVVTLVIAVFSYFLNQPFDYFFISIFFLSIFAEFAFLLVKLNRKKKDLEEWRETHHEF
jgi:Ca2+/Na+ antiporter